MRRLIRRASFCAGAGVANDAGLPDRSNSTTERRAVWPDLEEAGDEDEIVGNGPRPVQFAGI